MSNPLTMVARSLSPSPASQAEMVEWKRLVAEAADSHRPLALHYFEGANQIGGYRLFYMLQYAKAAGVPRVALHSNGRFWIDEATDWLIESGVDEIVLEVADGIVPPEIGQRISSLTGAGRPAPAITVRPLAR